MTTKKSNVLPLRKKAKKKQPFRRNGDPWKDQRWFEVVAYWDHKPLPTQIEEGGQRLFVHGAMDGVVIVKVPQDFPRESIARALEALGKVGVRALAFSEETAFCKLRACTPQEEEVLADADKNKLGLLSVAWPPKADDGSHPPAEEPATSVELASERFAKSRELSQEELAESARDLDAIDEIEKGE